MSRFFVGQRVRLIASRTPNSLPHIGDCAVVYAAEPGLLDADGDAADLWIQMDSGKCLSAMCWQLEPILPEGHQPARWEDCAWQPDHLRERVA